MALNLRYFRTYLNHVFLGKLWRIDNRGVGRYFAKLRPSLAQGSRPLRIRRITLSEQESLELIVAATGQATERRQGTLVLGQAEAPHQQNPDRSQRQREDPPCF